MKPLFSKVIGFELGEKLKSYEQRPEIIKILKSINWVAEKSLSKGIRDIEKQEYEISFDSNAIIGFLTKAKRIIDKLDLNNTKNRNLVSLNVVTSASADMREEIIDAIYYPLGEIFWRQSKLDDSTEWRFQFLAIAPVKVEIVYQAEKKVFNFITNAKIEEIEQEIVIKIGNIPAKNAATQIENLFFNKNKFLNRLGVPG